MGGQLMKRAILLAALVGMALPSHADEKKLTVAIFAPNAPFASGTERFNFIQRLAQQISSVAGVPAEGKAFARASDLEAAIRKKQIDFAVIDGVFLAEKGAPYPVLAIATTGGETQPKWALYSEWATDVKSLQGKKLAMPSASGRDDEFIGNALFDGELQVKKFFGGKTTAPDVASAVAAVKLHRADAVFAPAIEGRGMKAVFDAGRIPNAAFCDTNPGAHSSEIVSKVRSAVLSHSVSAAIDGWKSGEAGVYRALAARMSPRAKRPIMAEPDVVNLGDADFVTVPELQPSQPELKNLYWNP